MLTVTSNQPPTGTILQPPGGTTYAGGDTITYSGAGSDPQDGTLPPSAFTWRVDFHHESHVHPFIPDTTGSTGGSFTIPNTGHTAADVWYRIILTVRDSGGLTHTTFRDLQPRTSTITLATNVAGLQLELDAQPVSTPHSVLGVVGVNRSLGAPSPQSAGGKTYEFVSWSDGGAQTHSVATPGTNTTYTATYREIAGPPPPPTQGIVGYWAFDEATGTTAVDGSGNGHAGTFQYGVARASVVECRRGGCVSLDGVDDYVRILDAAALKLIGDVTVSAWIKPTGLGTAQSIVSKRYEFELGEIASASPYGVRWTHKATGGTTVSGSLTSSTAAGQWQHVVLVRNGTTKQVAGYLNGSPALTSTYTLGPATNTYNLNIGRNPGGTQRFKGLIDEVRLYNRALTATEVQGLFAQ